MLNIWARFIDLSPAARVLILNGLTFNFGFYMLMPYLAGHLSENLGLAGWAVGLVLGIRVFSQQGLFLLGGLLGDRIGYRRAILIGCGVRCVGFAVFGFSESLTVLLLAACLSGFAGALFTPCAQAYLADECQDAQLRKQAFALHNMASTAGMLLGPLAGLLFISVDFSVTGSVAAALFAVMTLVQWRFLPLKDLVSGEEPVTMLRQCLDMLQQWPFLRFALLAAAYPLLFHPLYLAVPAYSHAYGGGQAWVTQVFVITALVGVLLQMPVSALRQRWLSEGQGMGAGLALMACSYGLLAEPLVGLFGGHLAVQLMAALFSLGSLLVLPLLSAHVPHYAKRGQLAAYYGFFAGVGGLVALLSNVLIGRFLPADQAPPQLLWWSLSVIGIAAAVGIAWHMARLHQAEVPS
ncbi:MFS transporter [Pseudomonas sp. URMO17WK12:I4]|uniref:MFS transporter n=1 Tax=Pseudomonas sp. URMO17WK12:I4 TaxID=1283292 RepID=UPI0004BA3983|nr:MFS transporter [Pseudomonas sp. URMO17WK12:I4]